MEEFQRTVILLIVLTAAFWDLRKGCIPNRLIYIGLAAGAAIRAFSLGFFGIIVFLVGTIFALVLPGGLFYFRMIGAGDVKLLAVLGGFLGIRDYCVFFMTALFFGGIFALGLMISRGNLVNRFQYFTAYLTSFLKTGDWRPYRQKDGKDGEFPFTIPIVLSILCYVGGFI